MKSFQITEWCHELFLMQAVTGGTYIDKKLGKSYNWQFWAIIALPMIYAFVFAYIPMGGIIVAFQKYSPRKGILGSEWVGLKYFSASTPRTLRSSPPAPSGCA